MLGTFRRKALQRDDEEFAVTVLRLQFNHLRTVNKAKFTGAGKAALHTLLRAFGFEDLRVDTLLEPIPCIHNEQTAQDTDLRSSQANAIRFLQGVRHIVKQLPQPLVELFDRTTHLVQRFVLVGQYCSDSHRQ